MGQTLQQRHRAAFANSGLAVDHEILLKTQTVLAATEQRKRHTGIPSDVLHLLPHSHMTADKLVSLDANPHDRHLRAAVRVQCREMRKRAAVDQRADILGDD